MSKKKLSTIRSEFANFFRSSNIDDISTFLKTNFTETNLKSNLLDHNLINHLWNVGFLIVREYVVKYRNITEAQNLLNIFSEYRHTFSEQIEDGFKVVTTSLEKYTANDEYMQIEAVGETSASSTSEFSQ